MQVSITRRSFLHHAFQASALLAAGANLPSTSRAIPALQRPGQARLLLSLAAYSFRDYFRDSTHQQKRAAGARQLDMLEFIDYCADHGCDGTELTSYYFPKPVTNDFLLALRHKAFMRGVAISGTAVGNAFTSPDPEKRAQEIAGVKQWIDYAQVLGAPHIRVFAGAAEGLAKAEATRHAVQALQECCEYAGQKGIFLGLENHGGIVAEADDLLELVRQVDSRWFGVNLDSGNFHTVDPYADLARCAPYAVNVQIKTELQKRGQRKEPTDFERVVQILRDANYQGYVALEYEAAEDPWQAVPRALTRLRELLR